MKENVHPKYEETTITCACGNVIKTRSTKKDIHVEICLPANKSWLIPAGVWTVSESALAWRKNKVWVSNGSCIRRAAQ